MNLFWCKVNVKRFGFDNLHQDFDIMRIVPTAMNACRDNNYSVFLLSSYIYIYIYIYIYKGCPKSSPPYPERKAFAKYAQLYPWLVHRVKQRVIKYHFLSLWYDSTWDWTQDSSDGSRVKWSNPENGEAPSPTPWCRSYRKGSLRVTLDYGQQLHIYIYIYIYIYI